MADPYARYYLKAPMNVGEHSAVFDLSPDWTWAMIRGGDRDKNKLTAIHFKGEPHRATLKLKVSSETDPLGGSTYEVIFGMSGVDPHSPDFKAAQQPAMAGAGIDDTKLAMDKDPPPPPWLIWEFAAAVSTKG